MLEIQSISDIERLRESVDLECKHAFGTLTPGPSPKKGRGGMTVTYGGRGAVPEDFWPTYSAFANTAGGVVLLGIREKAGKFHVEGIAITSSLILATFLATKCRKGEPIGGMKGRKG